VRCDADRHLAVEPRQQPAPEEVVLGPTVALEEGAQGRLRMLGDDLGAALTTRAAAGRRVGCHLEAALRFARDARGALRRAPPGTVVPRPGRESVEIDEAKPVRTSA